MKSLINIMIPTFVSIGNSCVIAHQLKKHKYQTKYTNFFDWLVSSVKTVTQLLRVRDLQELKQKLINLEFEEKLFEGHKVVICKSFDCMKSVHDLPPIVNYSVVQEHFVNKYVRRYERFMDIVCRDEYVIFVLFVNSIDDTLLVDLKELILKLCLIRKTHTFHVSVICKLKQSKKNFNKKNLKIFYLEDYKIPSVTNHTWTLEQFDWKDILSRIAS